MDPLLTTLQVGQTGVFNLTRNLLSISIRDQMVRASMIASALPVWLAHRPAGADGARCVLVAGGGAGGMTAAVGLAMAGVKVEVVDPAARPFELQRNCAGRYLDAMQYDWPMNHWGNTIFPWQRQVYRACRAIPFRCPAAQSNDLVTNHWDQDFQHHLQQPYAQNLAFHWGRALLAPPTLDPQNDIIVYLRDQMPRIVHSGVYQAVIVAFGFGVETCQLPPPSRFVGYRFWETDSFEQPFSGLTGPGRPDTVMISGTGDGGLQDFLRVMTRQPSARQIYDDLSLGIHGINLNRIHSADHRLERAAPWEPSGPVSPYPFARAAYYAERHQECLLEIRSLLNRNHYLRGKVVRYLQGRPRKTVLISRFDYFDCLYVLNLFLALLLIESLRLDPDDRVRTTVELLTRTNITAINSAAPNALPPHQLVAQQCVGHPWNITLADQHGATTTEMANLIIIRHGLQQAANLQPHQAVPTCHPRPMPPTHLH